MPKKHSFGTADGDISWNHWTKQTREEYEKSKKASAVEQPLHDQSEDVEKMVALPKQLKRKRKDHEESKELPKAKHGKSDSAERETGPGDMNNNTASAPLAQSVEQDTPKTQHKKKKKTKHKERNHDELKETSKSSCYKQIRDNNVHHEKTVPENPISAGSKEKNNSVQKLLPGSMLATVKIRELKAFLETQGMTLKEWKRKRKEENKMWKGAKETKRLKQSEKVMAAKNFEENKEIVGNGRNYTVSIALPGSILDNAQSPELKTYLAGQIARAAAVFNINEIVVFEESGNPSTLSVDQDAPIKLRQKHGSTQLIKILQFLECPQYLRRYFFPIQNDLMFAGVLNPLDMPHHLRINDVSQYREGVTLDKPIKGGKGSYVYIGFPRSAVIDKAIEPNVRVTVKLDEKSRSKKHYSGVVVSPSTPYKQDGIYWGYNVRLAESLGDVFSKCPFKEGYDLTIGTSDKGSDVDQYVLPSFKHLLIVFGGLKGLEASLEADEKLTVNDPCFLFHHYLNTCPSQGARTIRTEEAVLITLSVLRPKIVQCQSSS